MRVIEAAGGVVWRTTSRGRMKLLLVHRPDHDDWSFPKGKLLAGETALDAALREVREETGLRCETGPRLAEVRTVDRKGRDKRIQYWAMQPVEGGFRPNREVDAVRWLRPEEAAGRLTYDHDIPLLAMFLDLVPIG